MREARLLLLCWGCLSAACSALWLLQVRWKDASHVDIGWAAGLGATALVCAAQLHGNPIRRALVGAMAAAWALRLSLHLFWDRIRGKPEDGRYAALRRSWEERANWKFFLLFQAQAALVILMSLSFVGACERKAPVFALDALSVLIGLAAVAGETAADRQLAAFRGLPSNRGKTCRSGLWAYSRHPNYFFEWLYWLSYAAMAPLDWRVWTSPALLLYFLFKVTGIPVTEAQAIKSRGEDYRDYQRTTPAFVPWRRKRPA